MYARYSTQNWLLRSILATDVDEAEQRTLLKLEDFWIWRSATLFAWMVGPSLIWSDHEFIETYFGVTQNQSLLSGLPEYGLYSARVILAGHFRSTLLGTFLWFTPLGACRGMRPTVQFCRNGLNISSLLISIVNFNAREIDQCQ